MVPRSSFELGVYVYICQYQHVMQQSILDGPISWSTDYVPHVSAIPITVLLVDFLAHLLNSSKFYYQFGK